jgi:hypothetical protein
VGYDENYIPTCAPIWNVRAGASSDALLLAIVLTLSRRRC